VPVLFRLLGNTPCGRERQGYGKFYNRVQIFEKWFRKIVAILFIAIGIYYAVILYL